MNIRATSFAIRKHATALLAGNYSRSLEKELIRAARNPPPRQYGHPSHSHAEHLVVLDKILGNHGVEGFNENGVEVQYSNTGDTYALTLMYVDGELRIGDWGSIVEAQS